MPEHLAGDQLAFSPGHSIHIHTEGLCSALLTASTSLQALQTCEKASLLFIQQAEE
jgi:hypothetical protein